jgi:predicted  nucleic acid-binding Zn-ribbon protein
MGTRVRGLYDLQAIDLEIDEVERSLRVVESGLGESEELRSARGSQAQASERQAELRRRLRNLELDLEEVIEKRKTSETTLYSGQVKSPKELTGLEQEVQLLKRRQVEVEDKALEVMSQLETANERWETEKKRLERLETEWGEEQAELKEKQAALSSRHSLLRERRESLQATIDPEDLATYEDLRRRKGRQGVALVQNEICQGCGVAVSTSKVTRVLRGEELVHCANCERVLYLKG